MDDTSQCMNNNLHTPSALRARPPDSEGQSVTIAPNFLPLRQGEYPVGGRGWIKLKGENGTKGRRPEGLKSNLRVSESRNKVCFDYAERKQVQDRNAGLKRKTAS